MICCGKSDIGRKRSENQDNFLSKLYTSDILLAVVCDGMGGVHGGQEASRIAVNKYVEAMDAFVASATEEDGALRAAPSVIFEAMTEAVRAANDGVLARTREDTSLRGMGTTLVSALVVNGTVYSVNVGDSRLYVVSAGQMEQITKDHSLVQYLVDIGRITPEEALSSTNRNIITRAVGIDPTVEPDTFLMPLEEDPRGAVLLLCSDGLTTMVPDGKIGEVLSETSGEGGKDEAWLASRAEELIRLANENGGHDNITVALVAV